MKTRMLLIMVSAVLMGTCFSSFVCAAGVKIGLIDTQRILQESKAAQSAREAIVQDLKEKQAVYQGKEREILNLRQEYAREKANLSTDEARDRQLELARSVKELRRLKADLEEELNRKNREWTAQILKDVAEIVSDFRSEEDYTFILEKKNVVTADPAIDVTDSIIRLYDRKKP
jgi:outer membrane protein